MKKHKAWECNLDGSKQTNVSSVTTSTSSTPTSGQQLNILKSSPTVGCVTSTLLSTITTSNVSVSAPVVAVSDMSTDCIKCDITPLTVPAPVVAVSDMYIDSVECNITSVVNCDTTTSNISVNYNITPALPDIPSNIYMKSLYFVLPCGSVFKDKKIPQKYDLNPTFFKESSEFSKQYFVNLHKTVASYGNYNYAGARN